MWQFKYHNELVHWAGTSSQNELGHSSNTVMNNFIEHELYISSKIN